MSVEPVTLRSERLLLRPYRASDVDDVLSYATEAAWSRYLPLVPYPYARRDAEEFIAQCLLTDWETNPRFALELEGAVVGGIQVRVNAEERLGEMGYSIAARQWGKGLTTEAARAVIDWALRALDLAKIYARADVRNEGSWRVMEKLGMQREATLRSHILARDGRADEIWYGLLREEWEGS